MTRRCYPQKKENQYSVVEEGKYRLLLPVLAKVDFPVLIEDLNG
jgi:hypothetical protein